MKSLVTYMSQTGNTKKIAEAIFEELPGEKEIKPLDEVFETDDADQPAFVHDRDAGNAVGSEDFTERAHQAVGRHDNRIAFHHIADLEFVYELLDLGKPGLVIHRY